MTDGTLFTGKTVEDALSEGLRTLGLTQDQVEVEILSRGSRGLFGIGSEPAQVRITPRRAPHEPMLPSSAEAVTSSQQMEQSLLRTEANDMADEATVVQPLPHDTESTAERQTPLPQARPTAEPSSTAAYTALEATGQEQPGSSEIDAERDATISEPIDDEAMVALAVELLQETVRLMGFEADVVASWQAPDDDNDNQYLLLDLHGHDFRAALIGRRGETLNNLQYLLRLMVNQRLHQWKNIVVDVEQYRQHRAEHLTQLALRSAEQVAKTGRPLSLEPMPSNERRIIHLALRDHANVYTESSGEGERRKIQIYPKRG